MRGRSRAVKSLPKVSYWKKLGGVGEGWSPLLMGFEEPYSSPLSQTLEGLDKKKTPWLPGPALTQPLPVSNSSIALETASYSRIWPLSVISFLFFFSHEPFNIFFYAPGLAPSTQNMDKPCTSRAFQIHQALVWGEEGLCSWFPGP